MRRFFGYGFRIQWRVCLAVSLWALLLIPLVSVSDSVKAQPPDQASEMAAVMANNGTARVLVALQAPNLGPTVGLQLDDIAQIQQTVIDELPVTEFSLLRRYETLPGLAGEVTEAGLAKLLDQPQVAAVSLDPQVEIALDESTALIRADVVREQLGFSGTGINVAVIDTGIDVNHPDLAGSLVAQKCFNRGGCPPDDTDEGDSAQDENGHGTHVAGIVAGRGQVSPLGVAPEAGLVAVRVLGASGGGFVSDVIAGIDWVVANQAQLEVKVINLSLGSGAFEGICDSANAGTQLYAEALGRATEAGTIVFASSGNSGLAEAMMAPACVSEAVSVGSSYDAAMDSFSLSTICSDEPVIADQVACFSNSSSALDLLAPGATIDAARLGGGQQTKSGTSMATAHASGVAALMLQANPILAPAKLKTVMLETGIPLTDTRTGRVTPRLDALAAVQRAIGEELTTLAGMVLLQGRTDHNGANILLSEAPCSSPEFAAPAAVTGPDGIFEVTTVASQTVKCLQVQQEGYLPGQRDMPAGDLGRITLPGGDMTGDGQIDIFDLAYMATRFGGNDTTADITADGSVNIFDLAIAAINFGQEGAVSTWE